MKVTRNSISIFLENISLHFEKPQTLHIQSESMKIMAITAHNSQEDFPLFSPTIKQTISNIYNISNKDITIKPSQKTQNNFVKTTST